MADGNNESVVDNDNFNPFSFSKFLQRKEEHTEVTETIDPIGPSSDDPDSDLLNENPFSIKKYQNAPKNSRKLQIVDDEEDTNDNSVTTNPVKERNDTDTDSDSFEARTPSPQMDSYVLPESSIDPLQQKIDQLVVGKETLQSELKKIKEEFLEYRQTANRRISSLQKELEKVRKKEADETKALEDVVHIVEENLQATTTRAAKAEATVSRLKEELQFYKEGSVPKQQYEKLVTEHAYLLNTIQEKSKNAAYLMRTAAEKTEPHVRQLQAGIASLRFLAEQFEDLGTIAELPKSENMKNDVT